MVLTRKFIGLIIIALAVGVNVTFGQNAYKKYGIEFVEPSPNSMSILDVVHQPVDLYTGTPEVSIPLTTLKGRTMEMPVSISYDASGNKVNEIASWVGLGWALNTGGMITRVVMDVPDDGVDGYFSTRGMINSFIGANLNTKKSRLDNFENGDWDNQPDMYYINVPGFSGKFVFDTNGNPLMLPDTDYILKPAIGPNAEHDYWSLTSPEGTVYYFGETLNSTETTVETRDKYDAVSGTTQTDETHTYISTWYLSKVVNNKGQEEFSLTYQTGPNTAYTNELDLLAGGSKQQLITTVSVQSPKYLSEISSVHGKLSFQATPGYRTDLGGSKSLEKVILKRNPSGDLKTFSFAYGYFQSGSNSSTQRLKLLSVQEQGLPAYTFDYYTTHNLPERNTHQVDAWGYHNGSTSLKSGAFYPNGADRSVDPNRVKASVLTKINYPTGGYKEFTYESNEYRLDGVDRVGGGIRVSSIRLHDGLSVSNDIVTDYNYEITTGVSSGLLNYTVRDYQHQFYNQSPITYPNPETILKTKYIYLYEINGTWYDTDYYIHYSSPINYIPSRSVGYSRIVVEKPNNGSSEYLFTDYLLRPDLPSNKYRLESLTSSGDSEYPIMPDINRDWERGLLLEENIKDNSDRLVKKVINTYQHGITRNTNKAKGIFFQIPSLDGFPHPQDFISFGIQEFQTTRSDLISTQERVYDQVSWSGTFFESKIEFEYGSHLQLSKEKVTNSSGEIDIIEYLYAADYNTDATIPGDPNTCATQLSFCEQGQLGLGDDIPIDDSCDTQYQICMAGTSYPLDSFSSAIKTMQDKNMISIPIEIIKKVERAGTIETISSTLTEYYESAGMVLPLAIHESYYNGTAFTLSRVTQTGNFEKHSSYEKRVNFNEYSSNGMLESLSKEGGDYELRYLYGYDGQLPIAEIKDSNMKSDVAFTSFETSEKGGWSFSGISIPLFTSRSNQIVSDAITGASVYSLNNLGVISKSSLDPSKRYLVSFWVKDGGSTVSINGSSSPTTIKARGWTLHLAELKGVSSVSISSQGAYIDELRIHPFESSMTTYTYDRNIGITSICSPANGIQYFEYDSNQRLKAILDKDWNYLKVFDYQYQVEAQNTGN